MKKLLAVFSLLLSLVVLPSITNAQIVSLPGVYVRDLLLDKSEYKAGEDVHGSFSLVNTENSVVPNIYYMTFLMGDYKNTIPQIQYDHSVMIGPFNLSANENRKVSFSYKLPSGASGTGLGIQIHATMQNGTGLGWADSMVKVTGGTGFLKFSSSYIGVGKDKFGLQDGPMVYEGEKVYLNTVFRNDSGTTIEATPKISIYNRSEVGGLLKQFDEPKITVKSKSDLTLNIDLPTFGFDPKVYVGKLDLVNSSGEKVAPTIDFRYIVNGDIVTINSVTSSAESVDKGSSVIITINYSGAPFDIMNGRVATSTPADFDLKVFNQKNVLVGEYTDKTDFNIGDKKIVNITATEQAKGIRVEAVAYKGDKVLARYNAILSKDFSKLQNESDWAGFFNAKNISLILLIIIAIIVIFLARKSPNRKITILFTLIFVLILAIVFIYASGVKAANIDTYNHGGDGSIYGVFSQVTPVAADPGTARTLQVRAYANACGNRGMAFTLNVAGQTKTVSRNQYSSNAMYNALDVTFNPSATPGDYNANYSATVDNFDHSNWASLTGHESYTVNCPSIPVPAVSVVASSTCEGGLMVSWSAVSNASGGYKIYKDGSTNPLATVSSATLSYNDTSVALDSSHSYRVSAISLCGSSAPSSPATANAAPMCPITSDVNASAYASTVPGQCGGKIDVSWLSIPHAAYYTIYRYNPVSGDVENSATTTSTTYRDVVEPGSVHKYAVQAFNAVSHSAISPLKVATATYDCTPNMIASCYATQNDIPVLNAAAGRVVWVAPIAGGVEPYNFSWMGSTTPSSGITTADVPAQSTTTYTNSNPDPIRKNVTISANSGVDPYYRDTSANCYVDVWDTINELATSTFTCAFAPASGNITYVNKPLNWIVTIPSDPNSELGIVASTSIRWTGSDGLTGNTAVLSKIYTTVGLKNASVTVFGKNSAGRPLQGTCSTSTNIVSGGNVQEQ
ncbi:MAG: hypothetical protein WC631_02670 [Candidatus Paceibacterota bacterium]|jgi:hypothetical protein